MPDFTDTNRSRKFTRPILIATLLLAAVAPFVAACGISFSEGESETEVFKKITVVGTPAPGTELTLGVDYEQPYSAALEVQCDLLNTLEPTPTPEPTEDPAGTPTPTPVRVPAPIPTPGNRIAIILNETIGANIAGGTVDESTPVVGSLSRKFAAPEEPGRYNVRCYTFADRNNQIFKSMQVK